MKEVKEMTNLELIRIFEYTASRKPYELAENTVKSYMTNIKYLIDYLDGKNILEITKADIRRYLLEISNDVSVGTYNLRINSFKSLYEVLLYHPDTEELVVNNPTESIKLAKDDKKKKKPLTHEEQTIILKSCKNKRDKAIFTTLIDTGLRIHELVNLTLDQYLNRDENGGIYLEVNKGSYKDEYVYINESTAKVVDEYLEVRKEGCEYLFVSNGGKQMDRSCISKSLKNIARRTGEFTEDRISQLCNHLMRHTKATNMVEANVPIDIIARTLRHHGLGVVMTYVDTSKDRIIEANK
jgi:integrase/recombinase XerD